MPMKIFWGKKIREYVYFLSFTYSVDSNFAAKAEKSWKTDDNI